MEPSEIRRRLRDSMELAGMRQELVITTVLLAVLYPIMALTSGGLTEPTVWAVYGICIAVAWLPFLVFDLWKTFRIFQKCGQYIFCPAKLSKPHSGWPRGMMYFTVVLEDPADGSKFVANTRAIFNSHGRLGLGLEDYINKTVTIAYNMETETVVVIG